MYMYEWCLVHAVSGESISVEKARVEKARLEKAGVQKIKDQVVVVDHVECVHFSHCCRRTETFARRRRICIVRNPVL